MSHNTWIKYSTVSMNSIQEWYCDCKAGARVFGAFSHVTSIIWYLDKIKKMFVSKKAKICIISVWIVIIKIS